MCVCLDIQRFHFWPLALYCGLLPNYPLVGTTAPIIPSFESCNSLSGLPGPHLVSYPWRLGGLRLPEVLTRGVLRTFRGTTETSRALESAYVQTTDVSGDGTSMRSFWHLILIPLAADDTMAVHVGYPYVRLKQEAVFYQQLQLDWPSIADWACASIFAVELRFQIWDQFWIPQPERHRACSLIFFLNQKKWARLVVFGVFGNFSENSMVLR